MKIHIRSLIFLALATVLLFGCGRSQKQWAGPWKIDTAFCRASIIVSEDGSYVAQIAYESLRPASRGHRQTTGDTNKPLSGWPIGKDGTFEVKDIPFVVGIFGLEESIVGTLTGQFDMDGHRASGVWSLKANNGDPALSENWKTTR